MVAVYAQSSIEAAIAVSDWLLSCLELRKPEKYHALFQQFFALLQKKVLSQELFEVFLTLFDEILELLEDTERDGGIQTSLAQGDQQKTQTITKTFAEVLRESEDFLTSLLLFAKDLDEQERVDRQLSADAADWSVKNIARMLLVLRGSDDDERGDNNSSEDQRRKAVRFCELRLKMMMAGYNTMPSSSKYRYAAFNTIVDYAALTNQFVAIVPYINYLDAWMEKWSMLPEQRRRLLAKLARELKKLKSFQARAYHFHLLHVKAFNGESVEVLEEPATVAAAVELIEDAVSLPEVMHFDSIAQLAAVQQLRDIPQHSDLITLLQIFIQGDPAEFDAFYQKKASLFEKHKLDYNQCLNKIRLLSLTSLVVGVAGHSATASNSEISLPLVSKKLGMSEETAEELVVVAAGQNLLDAKIDQLNKKILVKSAVQREFGPSQWNLLQVRLNAWSETTKQMLNILRSAKPSDENLAVRE